jgi:hypothetical protein
MDGYGRWMEDKLMEKISELMDVKWKTALSKWTDFRVHLI